MYERIRRSFMKRKRDVRNARGPFLVSDKSRHGASENRERPRIRRRESFKRSTVNLYYIILIKEVRVGEIIQLSRRAHIRVQGFSRRKMLLRKHGGKF